MAHEAPLVDRRRFLQQGGLGLVACQVAGAVQWLSPAQARAQGAPLKVLTADEQRLVESFAEVLVPGAAQAGVAHFVDHHLSVPAPDSLLMLRYLDWPAPYAGFYKAGLAGLRGALAARGVAGAEPSASQWDELIAGMNRGQPPGWEGIPAALFYFVLRSDAIDVVYGTQEGFARLGIPYMPHIVPPTPW